MLNKEEAGLDSNLSFQHATQMLDLMLQQNPNFLYGMQQIAELNPDEVKAIGNSMSKTADQLKVLGETDLPTTRGLGEIANSKDRTARESNLLEMAESCLEKDQFEKAKTNNLSAVAVGDSIRKSLDNNIANIDRQIKQEKDKEVKTEEKGDPRVIGVMHSITEQIKEYLDKPIIEHGKAEDKDLAKDNKPKTEDKVKEPEIEQSKGKKELEPEKAPELPEPDSKMASIVQGFKRETEGYGLDTIRVVGEVPIDKAIESGSKEAVKDIDSKAVSATKEAQNKKAFSSPLPPKK